MDSVRDRVLVVSFALVVALSSVPAQSAGGERRVALVIGNTEYAVGPLVNPVNDAGDVAEVLERIGFDVTLTLDRTLSDMVEDLRHFRKRLAPGDVVFFFYAGHAVQVDGENFLLPIDNDGIRDRNALRRRAISAQEYIDTIQEAATRLNVVVLDACRDNPLPGDARSGARGLAPIRPSRDSETAIVFSTSAGDVAEDGTGRNSVFTEALLQELERPDQDVYQLFNQVGRMVRDRTDGAQIPAFYTGPLSPFIFVSSQQLAQEAERESQIARDVVSSMEAEIATLQEAIAATEQESARQELELERRRRESQLVAAQLEARQLHEEAQRRAEEAETARQMQARMQRLAEESRAQQAEMSELVAARRAELEALQSRVDAEDPDELIDSILEIERTLADIAAEYETVWKTVENQVNDTFDRQLVSLDEVEPNFWETDARFNARMEEERSAVELERERVLTDRRDEVRSAERGQAEALERQLSDTEQTLYDRSWDLMGEDVQFEFVSFDRNAQEWRFSVSSNDPAIPVENWPVVFRFEPPSQDDDPPEWFSIVFDRSADVSLSEVRDFETARTADALAARITWTIRRRSDERFETWVESVDVLNLADDQEYSHPLERIVAEFRPGQRKRPLAWVPVIIESRPDFSASVFFDGSRIGATPVNTFLPLRRNTLDVHFDNGIERRVRFHPGRGNVLTVVPPVARIELRPLFLATNLASIGHEFGDNDGHVDSVSSDITSMPSGYLYLASGLQLWGGLSIKTRRERPVHNWPVIAAYGMLALGSYEYEWEDDRNVMRNEDGFVSKIAFKFGAGWGLSLDWEQDRTQQEQTGLDKGPGPEETSRALVLMPVVKISRFEVPEPSHTFSTFTAGGMAQLNLGFVGVQYALHYDLSSGDIRHAFEFRYVPTALSALFYGNS